MGEKKTGSNASGHPMKWDTPEKLQEKIDEFFKELINLFL